MPVTLEQTLANAGENALTSGIGGLASSALGALTNSLFGKTQEQKDQEQLQQQEKLQQQQIQGSEQLDQYQQNLQLETWRATNAPAQVAMDKAAGLNPALMYGGGGGGGATASAPTTTVTGASAPDSASQTQAEAAKTQAQINQSMQLEQMKVMDSQAELNTAQATKIAGVDTKNVEANTANTIQSTQEIVQRINNEKATQASTELDNQFKQIQNLIQSLTSVDQVETVSQNLENLSKQGKLLSDAIRSADVSATVQQDTIKQQVAMYEANLSLVRQELLQSKALTGLTQQQAQAINTQLEQGWQDLKLKAQGQKVSIENTETMVNGILKSAAISGATTIGNTLVKSFIDEE